MSLHTSSKRDLNFFLGKFLKEPSSLYISSTAMSMVSFKGMFVNNDVTSKLQMKQFSGRFMLFNSSIKLYEFFREYVLSVIAFTKGTKNFARWYEGVLYAASTGLKGVFGLCIFGSPYKIAGERPLA